MKKLRKLKKISKKLLIMPNERISIQNLVDELVSSYTQSKYDKKYLKGKINEILKFILPKIAIVIKNEEEKRYVKIWNTIKEDEKIRDLFRELLEKVERPVVIYITSKFENNQYFGTKIVEEAIKWK